jgi:acetoacetate decarboxylase
MSAMHRAGEVAGWPKLVVRYPTDRGAIEALLPPGFRSWGEPEVQVGVYCVPVHGEPEYGISTKVPANFGGVDGWYSLGIGIDQESAIFISRETNGQPKFPCEVRFFRLGDEVHASATHQGATFVTYRGTLVDTREPEPVETTEHEWWIKYSRCVGGGDGFDLPPRVVQVSTSGVCTQVEMLEGELTLRPSDWDPLTTLLPRRGVAEAQLVSTRHTARSITVAGGLDPDAFGPFADTIGGSRWPGQRGAPRRPPAAPGGPT